MKNKFLSFVGICILAGTLSACFDSANTNSYSVIEISCTKDGLRDDLKCEKIDKRASDIELLLNAKKQTVQLLVVKNSGTWFQSQNILKNCEVLDAKNWKCLDEVRGSGIEVVTTYGMAKGHWYRTITGGGPPYYWYSSISGWRKWLFDLGLISLSQAEKLD